jgi:hypothetical protein
MMKTPKEKRRLQALKALSSLEQLSKDAHLLLNVSPKPQMRTLTAPEKVEAAEKEKKIKTKNRNVFARRRRNKAARERMKTKKMVWKVVAHGRVDPVKERVDPVQENTVLEEKRKTWAELCPSPQPSDGDGYASSELDSNATVIDVHTGDTTEDDAPPSFEPQYTNILRGPVFIREKSMLNPTESYYYGCMLSSPLSLASAPIPKSMQ